MSVRYRGSRLCSLTLSKGKTHWVAAKIQKKDFLSKKKIRKMILLEIEGDSSANN